MGATFIVAIAMLGLFAFLQVIIVTVRYYPRLSAQILESRERNAEAREVQNLSQPLSQPPEQILTQAPTPSPAVMAQAMQAVSESDRHFRVGDFEASLRQLQKAEALLPDDPMIQFRLGRTYDELDDKPASYRAFQRALATPSLPPEIRREAEQQMAILAQSLPENSYPTPLNGRATVSPDTGAAIRDETGLQPGAALGIVNSVLRDGQPGYKNLRVAIKARPSQRIDVSQMNVVVYFYEIEKDGQIVLTNSQPATQWISLPVDWAKGEPEILDIEYPLPESRALNDPDSANRQFYGYLVAVYYNRELQDSRAEPGRLSSIADLPLYLEHE